LLETIAVKNLEDYEVKYLKTLDLNILALNIKEEIIKNLQENNKNIKVKEVYLHLNKIEYEEDTKLGIREYEILNVCKYLNEKQNEVLYNFSYIDNSGNFKEKLNFRDNNYTKRIIIGDTNKYIIEIVDENTKYEYLYLTKETLEKLTLN
jgi:hypothetical protein